MSIFSCINNLLALPWRFQILSKSAMQFDWMILKYQRQAVIYSNQGKLLRIHKLRDRWREISKAVMGDEIYKYDLLVSIGSFIKLTLVLSQSSLELGPEKAIMTIRSLAKLRGLGWSKTKHFCTQQFMTNV